MKNIHVLPTNKLSRLYYHSDLKQLVLTNKIMLREFVINQNIYITKDEEIKEGDWLLSIFDGKIQYLDKCTEVDKNIDLAYNGKLIKWTSSKHCKKIILTTDQDLIKDGVQEIPDEFLEWFVKNPTCEEIGINKLLVGKDIPKINFTYKIIIPKEELLDSNPQGNKQARLIKELANSLSSKQETLEEAAGKYATDMGGDFHQGIYNAFKYGAKWQQERSYSEEDLKKAFYANDDTDIGAEYLTFTEWFEQYKKK